MKIESRWLIFLSIVIFLIALSQKTYCTNGSCGDYWSGLVCLLIGRLGVFYGGAFFTWFANIFLILAWATFQNNGKSSILFSIISIIIGLSFLLFTEIIIDEAGNYEKITGYKLGYWLWILSMLTVLIANIHKQKSR